MITKAYTLDGVEVITQGEIEKAEVEQYIRRGRDKYGIIKSITIKADGDFADIKYQISSRPFERIRRITGYLVGTLDRFNDAKRAEVDDRVPHDKI